MSPRSRAGSPAAKESSLWQLPEGVDEYLPPYSQRVEAMRRTLVDLFARWGYRQVMPPLIEYLETLAQSGGELDIDTFKLIDHLSGRTLGIRADITPQVARIDASQANRSRAAEVARWCYLGPVLRARTGPGKRREFIQYGCEIFGSECFDSDAEIVDLMYRSLASLGLAEVHIDIGHVGIFRALVDDTELSEEGRCQLMRLLGHKDVGGMRELLEAQGATADQVRRLTALASCYGEASRTLERARELLQPLSEPLKTALSHTAGVLERLRLRSPELNLSLDFAESRGYEYHTGLVCAAYVAGGRGEMARGGRYGPAKILSSGGAERPATGFSADLNAILELVDCSDGDEDAIFVNSPDSEVVWREIERLRLSGETVIPRLSGQADDGRGLGCRRRLVASGDGFAVVAINQSADLS